MLINIYLHDTWYCKVDFTDALMMAEEVYAEIGDCTTIITDASTNQVLKQFKIADHDKWYTFEEIMELLPYYAFIEVIDCK